MIYDAYDSPLGEMRLCCDGEYLIAVTFAGQKYADKHIPKDAALGSHPVLELTKAWLFQYFSGNIPDFLPPFRLDGTDFQKQVWTALLQIPYGTTVSYGEVAEMIGRPKAVRAVGQAVGKNPCLIVVPCHRVMGKNGSLTGFSAGLELKRYLLGLEQK